MEIGFRKGYGDGLCVAWGMNRQIGICDNVSIWNAIPVLILLHLSFDLMAVTKLWNKIVRLRMCKGRIGHANVLGMISCWLVTNELYIVLPITIKWDNKNYIADETHEQNRSRWCHTSYRCSGQSAIRSWTNADRHAAHDHGSNCMTYSTHLVHIVEMSKITHGRSWKSQRVSWMGKGEEVGLHITTTSVRINMRLIASRKHWNVIGQHHLSRRYCV